MDHEYKLRKELDGLQISTAQNRADIDILLSRPFTRYGKVLRLLDDDKCDVREVESNKVYYNVPILNGVNLERYTVVVIGFLNNSLLNPFIIGGLDVTSVLDGLVEYVDDIIYDMQTKVELSSDEPPMSSTCKLTATLQYDNQAYVDKPITLYNGDQLIATQYTDTNGNVEFSVSPSVTTDYTIKYKNLVSEKVTVKVGESLWYDPCIPNARIDEYLNSNAQLIQQDNGLATRSNNAGGWFRIPYSVSGDWVISYSLVQPQNAMHPWRLDCITSSNTSLFTCELLKDSANYTEGWFYMSHNGSSKTSEVVQLSDGDKIIVEKKGGTITVYYKCMASLSMDVSFNTPYWLGSRCDNGWGNYRVYKDINLYGFQ